MLPFEKFKNEQPEFWAFVKFVSQEIGYSKKGIVLTYSFEDIEEFCNRANIFADANLISKTVEYVKMRAELLENTVERFLMNGDEAQKKFQVLEKQHSEERYYCKMPLNKQKGVMKQVAFFTAIINILTEKTIREITGKDSTLGFNDDPKKLAYFINDNNEIVGITSRRLDGAYPGVKNPKIIWEIKEYYYATTFGSRVADGVYETELDGLEFKELYGRTGIKAYHVLFIDGFTTWWKQGKSYLCRLVDAVNSGTVDEVIVGSEAFDRWPVLLKEIIAEGE